MLPPVRRRRRHHHHRHWFFLPLSAQELTLWQRKRNFHVAWSSRKVAMRKRSKGLEKLSGKDLTDKMRDFCADFDF